MSEWTTAGMAWRDIAESAYKAYAASLSEVLTTTWSHLTPEVQIAWEAAVRQAGECLSLLGNTLPPDEQQWKGWIPPHFKEKF